jgi:subtilase family serine protease
MSLPKLSILILCILIFATFSFAAAPDRITGPIVAQQLIKLSAGVPLKAQPQFDQGPVSTSLKLGYMTLLTVPNASQQKAINKLLAQQQDRNSPLFHKWLTPEQYADRFGLSPNDIQKLTTWLQSQGFTIVSVARGRNFIVFSGTAAQAENAFQTQIHNFEVNGETHFSNTTPISIPAALSGIVTGVRGLSNFLPKPASLKNRLRRNYYDSTSSGTYLGPGDIATIYDMNGLYAAGYDGTGQTIAIMGQTDVYLADLLDFRTGFGLTTTISGCTVNSSNTITACDTSNLQYTLVTGYTDPGAPNTCGDLPEADLDIEWSGATAKGAQIIYVNAPVTYNSNCTKITSGNGVSDSLYYAIDNAVSPVISMSYGDCELNEALSGTLAADEAELLTANTEGITFVNSAGDEGAAACDSSTNDYDNLAIYGLAVNYPASSPSVTGVGGTAIPYLDLTNATDFAKYWSTTNGTTGGTAQTYIPEQNWNDDYEFGQFCVANPSNSFCTYYIPNITSALTAQYALGIDAAGGGVSACVYANSSTDACTGGFSQPSWQSTLSISGQAAGRFVPDVSLLATPNWPGYIWCTPVEYLATGTTDDTDTSSSCASGIEAAATGVISKNAYVVDPSVVGGTSASTPVFAGMVAILNQYLLGTSSSGLGNINPTLYTLAATTQTATGSNGFNQVVTGNNYVYCEGATPTYEPTALQCPASSGDIGIFGYSASNSDSTTGYNLVTGLGSIDLGNFAAAWAATRTTTTITVVSSLNPAYFSVDVQLTATLTPTGTTTPTGTVTIYDGTTVLASGTLSGGALGMGYSTSSLAVGTHSITAVYSGDGNNAGSTSTILSQVILAPVFTFTNTGSTSHTVLAGQTSLTYTFLATPTTPVSSPAFTSTVTFGCSFSPADTTLTNASCTFTPSSIAAGKTSTPVTMTITSTGPNPGTGSELRHRADNRSGNHSPWLPLTLPIAGVAVLGLMRGKVSRKVSQRSTLALLLFSLVLLGFLIACSTTPVSIALSSSTTTLWPNNTNWPVSTASLTATVGNTSNTAVNWTISPSEGSIASTGTDTATYTAPTVASGLTSPVTVTVTSQADSSKTATATINLETTTLPQTYTVTVTAAESEATSQTPQVSLVVQ